MGIKAITTNGLRRMGDREGLILQGCGGELQEWLDGINEMFTENGILKDGTCEAGCGKTCPVAAADPCDVRRHLAFGLCAEPFGRLFPDAGEIGGTAGSRRTVETEKPTGTVTTIHL